MTLTITHHRPNGQSATHSRVEVGLSLNTQDAALRLQAAWRWYGRLGEVGSVWAQDDSGFALGMALPEWTASPFNQQAR